MTLLPVGYPVGNPFSRMADRSNHVFVSPWPHRLAVVTSLCTLVLIFVGSVVTNTGSGLAVPDWPTTFGYNMFTYPPSMMVGGSCTNTATG